MSEVQDERREVRTGPKGPLAGDVQDAKTQLGRAIKDILVGAEAIDFPNARITNRIEEAVLKPGWKTTEGQLVGLVTAIIGLFVVFRWVSIGNAATITGHVVAIVQNVGPLVILYGVVRTYINSRGKIKSNAIKSNAIKAQAAIPPPRLITTATPNGITTGPADYPQGPEEHMGCAPAQWVSRRLDSLESNTAQCDLSLDKRLSVLEQAVYGTPLPNDNQALPKPILDRFLALERDLRSVEALRVEEAAQVADRLAVLEVRATRNAALTLLAYFHAKHPGFTNTPEALNRLSLFEAVAAAVDSERGNLTGQWFKDLGIIP